MSLVIATMRTDRARLFARVRRAWSQAMIWTPSDEQLRRMVQVLGKTAAVLDWAIKAAVILAALYLVAEVGSAFLPGGTVSRVLGDLR